MKRKGFGANRLQNPPKSIHPHLIIMLRGLWPSQDSVLFRLDPTVLPFGLALGPSRMVRSSGPALGPWAHGTWTFYRSLGPLYSLYGCAVPGIGNWQTGR